MLRNNSAFWFFVNLTKGATTVKILGFLMLLTLLAAAFYYMLKDIGLLISLKILGITFGISVWTLTGLYLLFS